MSTTSARPTAIARSSKKSALAIAAETHVVGGSPEPDEKTYKQVYRSPRFKRFLESLDELTRLFGGCARFATI